MAIAFNFEIRQISHITYFVGMNEYCKEGLTQKLSELKKCDTRFKKFRCFVAPSIFSIRKFWA